MSGLFGGSPKIPQQTAPPVPKQADETAMNTARAEMLRRRKAYGVEDTMLTSGILGGGAVAKKTLLGA